VSHLSTHVLDTTNGWPAAGVAVTVTDPAGVLVASGRTDADGRISSLGPDRLAPGEWTLSFATGAYWAALDTGTFHPRVTVTITVPETPGTTEMPGTTETPDEPAPHLHVPLLLSPFAYSTYRGS
jgi:5-hydroxyisourate hydrolase